MKAIDTALNHWKPESLHGEKLDPWLFHKQEINVYQVKVLSARFIYNQELVYIAKVAREVFNEKNDMLSVYYIIQIEKLKYLWENLLIA